LAPWITPFDPNARVAAAFLSPSASHWFGTDEIGRDLFSRVILGTRYTWFPALVVIAVSVAIGSIIGALSGAVGGIVDIIIQRVLEVFFLLPSAFLVLAVSAALGPGLSNTVIALCIVSWASYARITRDEVRRLKARPHFEAARIAGARGLRLLLRYLLPGAIPALLVIATLDIAGVILILSLMSFLGLGEPAPAPELGAMTARTLDSLTTYWWLPILPASAIFVMCLLSNLAGDGLRAALKGV
jgi:peptide/nickel transport system permease protein